MVIKDKNGIYHVEYRSIYTPEDILRFDNRYGVGNWKFTESVCRCLSPECGYGPPLDGQCSNQDGKCYRPRQYFFYLEQSEYSHNWPARIQNIQNIRTLSYLLTFFICYVIISHKKKTMEEKNK